MAQTEKKNVTGEAGPGNEAGLGNEGGPGGVGGPAGEQKKGVIPGIFEVILGPMRSRKSTRLCEFLTRDTDIGRKVVLIIHKLTSQREGTTIDRGFSTHNSTFTSLSPKIRIIITDSLAQVDNKIEHDDVIGIEEGQMFDSDDIDKYCRRWVFTLGKDIYVAGLNGDYRMRPFGGIVRICAMATKIYYLTAKCDFCIEESQGKDGAENKRCIKDAYYTVRTVKLDKQLVPGSKIYKAACSAHYYCLE